VCWGWAKAVMKRSNKDQQAVILWDFL